MPATKPLPPPDAVFLAVGTRILTAEIVDQMIRSMGNYRTRYANDMAWALRTSAEEAIDVLITELDLTDSSAFRLIQTMRANTDVPADLYVILAVEEKTPAVVALAEELEINSVMVKPFTGKQVQEEVTRYQAWEVEPDEPWRALLREAEILIQGMHYVDAEKKLDAALAIAPPGPEAPFRYARYHCTCTRNFASAETLVKRALLASPQHLPSIALLGAIYEGMGRWDDALKCLRLAQKVSPLNTDRALQLVRIYRSLSLELCKQQLDVDPADSAVRIELSRALFLGRDYRGVVRELERTLPVITDASARTELKTMIAIARKLGNVPASS